MNNKYFFILVSFLTSLTISPLSANLSIEQIETYAEAGAKEAQYALGNFFYNGTGTTQNYQEAAKWFRLAANQGMPQAQYNLGIMYQLAQGVPRDLEEARKRYQAAANQNLPEAQHNLGNLYYNGLGVSVDYGKASNLFEKSAGQGVAQALYKLGLMHGKGQHYRQDLIKSYSFFLSASKKGHKEAQRAIQQIEAKLTPLQIAQLKEAASGQAPIAGNREAESQGATPRRHPMAAIPMSLPTSNPPAVQSAPGEKKQVGVDSQVPLSAPRISIGLGDLPIISRAEIDAEQKAEQQRIEARAALPLREIEADAFSEALKLLNQKKVTADLLVQATNQFKKFAGMVSNNREDWEVAHRITARHMAEFLPYLDKAVSRSIDTLTTELNEYKGYELQTLLDQLIFNDIRLFYYTESPEEYYKRLFGIIRQAHAKGLNRYGITHFPSMPDDDRDFLEMVFNGDFELIETQKEAIHGVQGTVYGEKTDLRSNFVKLTDRHWSFYPAVIAYVMAANHEWGDEQINSVKTMQITTEWIETQGYAEIDRGSSQGEHFYVDRALSPAFEETWHARPLFISLMEHFHRDLLITFMEMRLIMRKGVESSEAKLLLENLVRYHAGKPSLQQELSREDLVFPRFKIERGNYVPTRGRDVMSEMNRLRDKKYLDNKRKIEKLLDLLEN